MCGRAASRAARRSAVPVTGAWQCGQEDSSPQLPVLARNRQGGCLAVVPVRAWLLSDSTFIRWLGVEMGEGI